jgi:nucleoid DNA-binding protein
VGTEKLTKAEIIENINERVNVSKISIHRIIDLFIFQLKEGLLSGKTIELRGLGTFEVRMRKGRRARNPKTGEKVEVENHGVVYFRPGRELKKKVWSLRG